MSTQDRVIALISEYSAKENVRPEQNLHDDLDMDSLDKVEAVMAIEDEFDFNIDDEDIAECKTVADVIALVERMNGEVVV
jgi:acyl carrier protein